jgi:hypothetical protein
MGLTLGGKRKREPAPTAAPEKAKTGKGGAPAKAKRRAPKPVLAEEKIPDLRVVRWDVSFAEAETRVDKYLDRHTHRAIEVWLRGQLAYRAYGLDHPLNRGRKTRGN